MAPQDPEPEKITLLLGPDTLQKLNAAMERGGFGSRGRTIDALFDAVWDIASLCERSMDILSKSAGEDSELDQSMAVLIAYANLSRQGSALNRFVEVEFPDFHKVRADHEKKGLKGAPPGA